MEVFIEEEVKDVFVDGWFFCVVEVFLVWNYEIIVVGVDFVLVGGGFVVLYCGKGCKLLVFFVYDFDIFVVEDG